MFSILPKITYNYGLYLLYSDNRILNCFRLLLFFIFTRIYILNKIYTQIYSNFGWGILKTSKNV